MEKQVQKTSNEITWSMLQFKDHTGYNSKMFIEYSHESGGGNVYDIFFEEWGHGTKPKFGVMVNNEHIEFYHYRYIGGFWQWHHFSSDLAYDALSLTGMARIKETIDTYWEKVQTQVLAEVEEFYKLNQVA